MQQAADGRSPVVIITGGASGIGYACSELFVSRGWRVVIAGRSHDRGAEAVTRLAKIRPDGVRFHRTDLSDPESIEQLFHEMDQHEGRLDALVNNSGIAVAEGDLGPVDVAAWDALFDVNVRGLWLSCVAALPSLAESRGSIVNLSSMNGMLGVADSPGYAASKAAVNSLTMSLALAWADRDVRVNAVCPGPIDAGVQVRDWESRGSIEEGKQASLAMSPIQQIGQASDVAELVYFMAAQAGPTMTGAIIPIDGGKSAGLMPSNRYRRADGAAP